jgi:capsular polysaccharide biosynthesis protein
MAFRRRGIEAIAREADRLSPDARVHHTLSLAASRVPLPALRFGAGFLERWPVREEPMPASWRAADYDAGSPALFVLRDVVVHSSFGLVTIGPDIIEETLIRLDAPQAGALVSDQAVILPPGPITRLEGTHISLLAGGQTNFFHAMLDGLARSAILPPHWLAQASSVLLPVQGNVQQALFQHLGLPPHLAVRRVADGDILRIETLLLPMSVYGASNYHPIVGDFFDRISDRIADGDPDAFPRRIYLDRRGAPGRTLVNEAEVITKLAPLGFVPVAAEKLSLPDQVRLFRNAEAIVAPHGAGLTNLGFCQPGCAVLELQMDAYVHWGYRHLAALRNLDYDCIIGRALGPWPPRSPAVHGLRWIVSADHVAAAVEARTALLF